MGDDQCRRLVSRLAFDCARLESISLYKCSYVEDSYVATLVASCPQLKSVNLSFCQGITDDSATELSKLKHLQHVILRECSELTDVSLRVFCGETVLASAHGRDGDLLRLRRLNVAGCLGMTEPRMTEFIKVHGATLEHLVAHKAKNAMGDRVLEALGQHAPRLLSLRCSGCERVTSFGIRKLIDGGCPLLTVLDVSGCSKVGQSSTLPLVMRGVDVRLFGTMRIPTSDIYAPPYIAHGGDTAPDQNAQATPRNSLGRDNLPSHSGPIGEDYQRNNREITPYHGGYHSNSDNQVNGDASQDNDNLHPRPHRPQIIKGSGPSTGG